MYATPFNPRPAYVAPQVTPNQEPIPMTQEEYQYQNEVNQNPPVVMVRRNQDPDEVVRNVQNNNNFAGHNNLATLVETILNQNGLNTGTRRPNFVSALSEYVLQTELRRGWKVPKYTKFAGDTNESTVEHIARYLAESGNLANNENLRMKYFPNSLTKNAFTWFTTLPPNSIHNWTQLERLFHEQFYMGQTKISLKELASVKRKTQESVDDYLNRFRLLKARCFTSVPEHELVEMAAGGLDYSIRKKLDTQYLRDMSQLADRVRQIEKLKAEKARNSKFQKKKDVAFLDSFDNEFGYETEDEYVDIDDSDINVAELKPGPPYTCKLLRPSNGKNPVEPKNEKYATKTYTFDITKCDVIFDLLVSNGQIVVQKDLKIPPIEQRKKRGYCKFHNYLGHKTYQCVLFRDLVQRALNEGRLKFAEKTKPPMKVDTNPLPVADATYVEILDCNMVEVTEADAAASIKAIPEAEYEKKVQEVYPAAEEQLIDFLNRCKLNNSEVMLCPKCSAVCDKEAVTRLKSMLPYADHKRKWPSSKSNQRGWPHQKIDWSKSHNKGLSVHQRLGPQKTFKPSNKAPVNQWVSGQYVAFDKKWMEKGSSSNVNVKFISGTSNSKMVAESKVVAGSNPSAGSKVVAEPQIPHWKQEANKYGYRNNYKGKNPMTRTQWRRFQRKQKLAAQQVKARGNTSNVEKVELAKRPVKERLTPIKESDAENNKEADDEEDFMDDDDLLDDESDFNVLVNVVSVLPVEYDIPTEVNEVEEDFDALELADHKPVCYYVMENGCVEAQNAVFERPDIGMKNHLKALFIRAKVNNVGVNKILVNGGAVVNIMPHFMLKKLGLFDTDLHSHNVVLAKYEGKTGHSLGAVQLEVCVGSTIRKTLFMVIAARPNYNLLLGREWIHGVGDVPSSLHQRLTLWREDGLVENVEAYQGAYVSDSNTVNLQNFDKNLANIAPCGEQDAAFDPNTANPDGVYHSVKLHPTHGFCWEREPANGSCSMGVYPPASGWGDFEDNDD
ncbi:hypothetical protein QL285_062295 [Trifolium repens]|nr:hypothetical protein QL285_062295 [Trifolium repens]